MHDIPATTDLPGGVALWRRIAGTLANDIRAGTFGPEGRLPTEAALAARFVVNRHTVRRALDELSRAGLLRTERGRGSFAVEEVLDYRVAPRTRFSEWVRRQNKEPSGRMLDLQITAAPADIAAGLGVPEGAPVIVLHRLGFADDRPIGISWHWFSAERFPGLREGLARHDSVSAALAEAGLTDYRRKATRVSARMPSEDEARLLHIPRGRPLLLTENVNVDADDHVVEFGVGLYPTPRVQIVFEP
jgi:GntR family phosphonate transport system transcriptional regulator